MLVGLVFMVHLGALSVRLSEGSGFYGARDFWNYGSRSLLHLGALSVRLSE